ncbi:alpha/beta hydrolase [Xanthomonas cerealis]|uniref:alpha/beta hydrolase n=1 Tax=Xanthomonas cerealis TaxID=3390025 RepID=UPI0005790816|nr:alpha/beta fold hydrolase [Xanthomonas translucens]UKE47627.1 lysophospholipase [Xanthomonas translucens pv. cerealis]
MKPGNEARERWRLGAGVRTPVALLYLHGFTASPGEAGELPEQMADAVGANLYVHRWPGHGEVAADAMHGLTAERLEASAMQALDRARAMGEAVAIVGSSLGATLGLWLAATRPDDVAAVVAWSPGVQAADPALLDQLCAGHDPWKDPRPRSQAVLAYWSDTVHPDGLRALRETFRKNAVASPWPRVRCPVYLGYYRDPEGGEDQTASVPAMLAMFDALGTPPANRRAQAFAAGAHAIGSPHKTLIAGAVAAASVEFLQTFLPRAAHARAG